MKTTLLLLRALLVVAAAAPLALAAVAIPAAAATPVASADDIRYPALPEFKIPKPEQVTLGNGMILLLLPDRDLPLVTGTALIHTGARHEPAAKAGLASLTGSVLRTGGTARRSADQIDDLLEGIGARVESSIGSDQGRAGFSCLSRDLDTLLALVAEILREPAFAQDRIDVAKSQTRAAISRRNDDVQGITRREFAKLVYGRDSAYTHQTEYASLDAITRDDLVKFHRSYFHPNATLIGLTGDFDPKAVRAQIEKHFGSWPKGAAPQPFAGGYQETTTAGIHYIEKSDVNQSNILLGHLGILTRDPDYYAVSVLNEVFGGGFSARLFSNMRSKKGLAYSVGGRVGDDYDHPGVFRISLLTKSETTVAGIRALWEELDSIRKAPPTAEEMKVAKDAILNSFVFNFDTRAKVLERQLTYLYYGYPLDFLDRYRAGIEKVTAEDVLAAAKKHMRPDNIVQLVVGKGKDFDRPLEELGTVKPIDITIPAPPGNEVPKASSTSTGKGSEVVARAVATVGGREALGRVQAIQTDAQVTSNSGMGALAMKSVVLWQAPDRVRQVRQSPAGDMTMVLAGDSGWLVGPMGELEVPASHRIETLAAVHRLLPVLLSDPALEAQHVGQEDGADKVLVHAHGLELTLWINERGEVVKDSYQGQGQNGAPAEITRVYSDWRKEGALLLPHAVDVKADGRLLQKIAYSTIAVNPTVDPRSFEKPAPDRKTPEQASSGGASPGEAAGGRN